MCCRVLVIAQILLVLAAAGCEQARQAGTRETATTKQGDVLVRVTPIRPERKTLVRKSEQPGEIVAFEEAPLHAKVTGYVKKVHVDIGDRVVGPRFDKTGAVVKPGQILAELSIPELDEELNQKQALVAQATAEIDQASAAIAVAESAQVSAQAKIAESQAAIEKDSADFDRWQSEYKRMSELAANKSVAQKLVDETRNQLRAAQAAKDATAANIKSAEAQYAESVALVKKAKADHRAAQARLRVAAAEEQRLKALCSYGTIRAPFDGVISARNVHTGHLVQSAPAGLHTPLLIVVRTDIVRIFVDIPETDAVLTQLQNQAQVRVPSLSAEMFPAQITRTAWVLNTGTRTLKTELDIDNKDGKLRPGMYAYAEIKVAERPNALSVPRTAILTEGSQSFCYAIDSAGKVIRVPLTVGIQAGPDMEIVSGLKGDENVIGVNAAAFKPDQHVEIVRPPEKK